MNVVVAIDSFKGSLSSLEAGNTVKGGILRAMSNATVNVFPLADGGEGTTEALFSTLNGEMIELTVTGPLFHPIKSEYAIINNNTAVIEMSKAAGLTLVPENSRNPLETTTLGVGEMIKDAISKGCRNFIIGIGGSATNDGGIGMLSALGFEFLDENGNKITPNAKGLENLKSIRTNNTLPELSECCFRVACDVTNPLCGKNGSSAVFAPQKGATKDMIDKMDSSLRNYADISAEISDRADTCFPGAGAAGGLGFAFNTFLNARLQSGIDIVINEIGLEEYIKNADIVVTGEGRLDFQTVMGKAPHGVAKIAKKYNKKVIAFSGVIGDGAENCNENGIDAYFPILRKVLSNADALDNTIATENLFDTSYQVFRLINLFK